MLLLSRVRGLERRWTLLVRELALHGTPNDRTLRFRRRQIKELAGLGGSAGPAC
jgi:hypothetical protein